MTNADAIFADNVAHHEEIRANVIDDFQDGLEKGVSSDRSYKYTVNAVVDQLAKKYRDDYDAMDGNTTPEDDYVLCVKLETVAWLYGRVINRPTYTPEV